MLVRVIAFAAALILMVGAAQARRVALVIGQNAYPGGNSAAGLPSLDNPVRDARRMAELLGKHDFEMITCDGNTLGCFDLNLTQFLQALTKLEQQAAGADLALVFFAGHGMATEEGNILTPIDAKVTCATGGVTQGVTVERIMAATKPARHKIVILDACRDNPLGAICPNLAGKKLTFKRIEAGAMQGFLLVTSTQFGQSALDGLPGIHSPFAIALFAAFENNPGIYFEQVFNEVARTTYEAAQKQGGFLQIPGKVVGGAAPADCLAGKDCIGDARMAALAIENERLTKDAAGVRNILEQEEKTRGKPYTAEERQKRVAELEATLVRIGTSTDPLRQEARRLIDGGNVAGGQAKLDEALDADEKALAAAQQVVEERRGAAARSARDLAVLARGTDITKALAYFQRATRLDSSDPQTWLDYGDVALDAGRTAEAESAFSKAMLLAAKSNNQRVSFWATLRLGDVAVAQGKLGNSRHFYEAATTILEPFAKGALLDPAAQSDLATLRYRVGDVLRAQGDLSSALDSYRASLVISEQLANTAPSNVGFQFQLVIANERIGDVLGEQGDLAAALESYRASLTIAEWLTRADPGNAGWQRALSVSHNKIGDVLQSQGNLSSALDSHRASLAIAERLAKSDPANAGWQRDLSVSHDKVGDVLQSQGNLSAALDSYRASLAIRERLIRDDPGNAGWQRDLSVSHGRIGNMLQAQGDLSAALENYRAALTIAERLAASDPGNAGWQRDLSVSLNRIADVLQRQANLSAALENYRAALTIAERLAVSDPGNAGWQRDLSVSHRKIGNMWKAQDNLSAALDSYRAGLAIVERLAKSDPTNASWQRELSVSYETIADVLQSQGNLSAALDSYRAGLAIAERLAASDPANADWQFDLGVSNEHVGDILLHQAIGQTYKPDEAFSFAQRFQYMRRCSRAFGLCNVEPALIHYRAKSEIIERLVASDPSNATWQSDLASSHGAIGDALHMQGNLAAALDRYRVGFAIVERLAMADPANAGWQGDLAIAHARLAMVLAAQGQPEQALRAFHLARGIVAKLAGMVPNSLVLQDALRAFDEQIAELEKPNGRAETTKSGEGGDARSRTASEGSLPTDRKVAPKVSRKAPMTWQHELWRRQ